MLQEKQQTEDASSELTATTCKGEDKMVTSTSSAVPHDLAKEQSLRSKRSQASERSAGHESWSIFSKEITPAIVAAAEQSLRVPKDHGKASSAVEDHSPSRIGTVKTRSFTDSVKDLTRQVSGLTAASFDLETAARKQGWHASSTSLVCDDDNHQRQRGGGENSAAKRSNKTFLFDEAASFFFCDGACAATNNVVHSDELIVEDDDDDKFLCGYAETIRIAVDEHSLLLEKHSCLPFPAALDDLASFISDDGGEEYEVPLHDPNIPSSLLAVKSGGESTFTDEDSLTTNGDSVSEDTPTPSEPAAVRQTS